MNGQQAPVPPSPSSQSVTQRTHQEQPSQSSGNADLERLERLKREILDGQNPYYKAVPQPDFLENLYLGRASQSHGSSVPAHPEQIASGRETAPNRSSGEHEHNTRGFAAEANRQENQVEHDGGNFNARGATDKAANSAPVSSSQTHPSDITAAGATARRSVSGAPLSASANEHAGARTGTGSLMGMNNTPGNGGRGPNVEGRRPNENWNREQVLDDRYGRRPPFHDSRHEPPPRYPVDSRYPDRDREREFERDRDRERRPDYHFDDRRIDDFSRPLDRRPPQDMRDQRAQDFRRFEPRHDRPMDHDTRRLPPNGDRRPLALEERLSRAPTSEELDSRAHSNSNSFTRPPPGDRTSRDSEALDPEQRPVSVALEGISHSVVDAADIHKSSTETEGNRVSPSRDENLPAQPVSEQRIGGRTQPSDADAHITTSVIASENSGPNHPQPLQERISGKPLEERIGNRVASDAEERDKPAEPQTMISSGIHRTGGPATSEPGTLEDRGRQMNRDGRRSPGPMPPRPGPPPVGAPPVDRLNARPNVRRPPFNADARPPQRMGSPRRSDIIVPRDGYRERSLQRPGVVYDRDSDRRFNDDRRIKPPEFDDGARMYPDRGPIPPNLNEGGRPPLPNRQWRKGDSYAPPHNAGPDQHFGMPLRPEGREWMPNADRNYRPGPGPYRDDALPPRDLDRFPMREPPLGFREGPPRDDRRPPMPIPPPWERDDVLFHRNDPRPDPYGPDSRMRDIDRTRYPPIDDVRPHGHVRPRSPSPIRRDMGPPLKRPRDVSPYYQPDYSRGMAPGYHARGPSPPPGPPVMYDNRGPPIPPRGGREIPYDLPRDRPPPGGYYDRRTGGPMPPPPPPPRSPPYAGRTIYARDERDRSYGGPPPRTT